MARARNGDSHPRQKKHDSFDWLQLGITIAGVFVLCVYTGITGYQAWIARDTERRQLRAYVGASDPEVILDSPDGYIKIRIRAHNFGQTPAYKAQVNGGTMFFHDPPLATEAIPETAYDRSEKSSAVTIFPAKGEGTDISTSVLVEKPGIHDLEAGKSNLYIVGKITYEDTFGYFWFTDFCIIIRPANLVKVGTSRFNWCLAKYNHAT